MYITLKFIPEKWGTTFVIRRTCSHVIDRCNRLQESSVIFLIAFSIPYNYFISWQNRVPATGTIHSDRKHFPNELKRSEKLERGDYQYLTSNGVSVIKWKDKKEVLLASNYFDPAISDEVSRQGKDGSRKQISCSLAIIQYNKYMGGVDLSDQKIKYYAIDRKSKRNWIRIFLHFLNASWINSFAYYKNLSRSNISTVEYISSVSTALIGNCSSRKRLGTPLAITNQKRMRIEGSISDSVSSERGGKARLLDSNVLAVLRSSIEGFLANFLVISTLQ